MSLLIKNPTDCDIKDYRINGEDYTIPAGAIIEIDEEAGRYLMGIYSFLLDASKPHHDPDYIDNRHLMFNVKKKKRRWWVRAISYVFNKLMYK